MSASLDTQVSLGRGVRGGGGRGGGVCGERGHVMTSGGPSVGGGDAGEGGWFYLFVIIIYLFFYGNIFFLWVRASGLVGRGVGAGTAWRYVRVGRDEGRGEGGGLGVG